MNDLIPYAHVADLDRSIEFYRRLGFEVIADWHNEGRLVWAHLKAGSGRLMVALADAPVVPRDQAVLFYCYAEDVARLRERLLADGIHADDVTHPDYMPSGEIRVRDPDGYMLLIGQPSHG